MSVHNLLALNLVCYFTVFSILAFIICSYNFSTELAKLISLKLLQLFLSPFSIIIDCFHPSGNSFPKFRWLVCLINSTGIHLASGPTGNKLLFFLLFKILFIYRTVISSTGSITFSIFTLPTPLYLPRSPWRQLINSANELYIRQT